MGKKEEGGESFKKINEENKPKIPPSTQNVLDGEGEEYFLNDV